MGKEEFEGLLREVLPHAWAIREILEKQNASGTIDVRVNKDGYTSITHDDAEYTQFKPNAVGKVRLSWPLEL